MPEAELDSLSVDQCADFQKEVTDCAKKPFVLAARDEQGTIVGFVNGSLERDRDALYTAERYAKTLMLVAVKVFIEPSHNAVLLWVLLTNPARGFYEAMAGKYLKTKPIEIGGETLEVVYGRGELPAFSARYASASA